MTAIDLNTLSPVRRAREDHRAGCGQDDNPYSKTNDFERHQAWAWEMGRLWHKDFEAENGFGRQQQESGKEYP